MPKYSTDRARELILDRKTKSESYIQNFRDDWLEIYSLYCLYTKSYSDIISGNKANVFIPYVFSKIETKLPRIIQAMVGGDNWFQVIGVTEEDEQTAEAHDKLLKYQFSAELDTIHFFMTWYKECMLYGNSFAGVFYEKEVRKIKQRTARYTDKLGNNLYPHILGYDFKPKDKTVYDSISLVPFDIFDCYPAPNGTKINGLRREAMDYFIIRSEPSTSYLRSMVDDPEIAAMHGWDSKAVKSLLDSKPGGTGVLDRNRTERMAYRGMGSVNDDDLENPHYEMFTMWEDDSVGSIIENEVIRNCGPDKFPFYEMRKPIVMALDTPVPHELFALGQVRPILRLNYYAQDLENAKLDSILDAVYPGYTVSEDSMSKDYVNILRKNMRGVHMVSGPAGAAIAPIQKIDKSLVATNEQYNLERLINMTLGSSDIMSGQASAKQDTATEISAQIEQANYRFDLSIRLLKDFSHKELLMMMVDRNTQYCPDSKKLRVIGKDGTSERMIVRPEELLGDVDVIVKTSPMMGNKMVYLQNLLRAKDILDNDNGKHPELVKKIMDTLEIYDVEVSSPVDQAVAMIVQASQEGFLENGQQAALILGQVLNVLAPPPPGSQMPGPMPAAKDGQDIAAQGAQQEANAIGVQ